MKKKVKIVNEALKNEGFFIDFKNRRLFNFLKDFKETLTPVKKEINGYEYDGEKIIKRNNEGNFEFLKGEKAKLVIKHLKDTTKLNARSEIASIIENDSESDIEGAAEEYIDVLRDEQKRIIGGAENENDLENKIQDLNFLDEEIEKN